MNEENLPAYDNACARAIDLAGWDPAPGMDFHEAVRLFLASEWLAKDRADQRADALREAALPVAAAISRRLFDIGHSPETTGTVAALVQRELRDRAAVEKDEEIGTADTVEASPKATQSEAPEQDVDTLAEIIWNASRADEGTISATGANVVARAVLSSDWRVKDRAEVRAEMITVVETLLPDRCWVNRSTHPRCSEFIGGTFVNGREWTKEMCCLPCRIRVALAEEKTR